jgi:addiction module HigA family antidote
MHNPAHPGLIVKECLDDLGWTVAEAAAALHITRQQLHNIVAGRSGVTPEMAVRLSQAFGRSPESWLQLQVQYDLAQVRKSAREINLKPLYAPTGPQPG